MSQYLGIEEERWALEEMNKIVYKNRIDTYLRLLKNLNIKAGLTRIAWTVRVKIKLPEEILRRLSYYNFTNNKK